MKFNRVIWTLAKYIVLTVGGVLLYIMAAKCTLAERGYFAVGGEGLLLFLPVFYGVTEAVVRDMIKDLKGRSKRGKGVGKR